jgi:hypothetical protein
MNLDAINLLLSTSLKIGRGRIIALTAEGEIQVEYDSEGLPFSCEFLRTGANSPPDLNPGDVVLYAMDEMAMRGYVLGVIQKYLPQATEATDKLISANADQKVREIKINAEEKIELRCGNSALMMSKDGKIVIRGTNVTSRASATQKIKGATVQIN